MAWPFLWLKKLPQSPFNARGTTGTGFLDTHAMDALEFVTNGDVAIAGVQYSYLPSAISLLADVDEVRETAQVVFEHIHEYWSDLPDASRPDIYLYGLSLGSFTRSSSHGR